MYRFTVSDSDERLLAWFLGPKAENAEILERLILEALRDSVFWRRNFHPEDEALVTERAKRRPGFEDTLSVLNQEFLGLLAELKRGVPAYSPRYIGHMMSDRLLPSIAAYFAAMLHNPNNVSVEGSATTTRYELEVAQQLADLIGYGAGAWGHITSGGTIANIEALWMARNLELLPIAARNAAQALGIAALPVPAPAAPGGELDLVSCEDPWALMNLDVDTALTIPERLRKSARDVGASDVETARTLDAHSVSTLGMQGFFEACRKSFGAESSLPAPGVVLVPATAHYSLYKAVEALGIGKGCLRSIPVDSRFRMDLDALRDALDACLRDRVPVYAVVSVLGSSEEGSVDQVHEVAALRDEYRERGLTFFHHCDAAWGGYVKTLFVDADDRPVEDAGDIVRLLKLWPPDDVFHSFQALHRTDSFTVDPHKLGYVPYPCGAILFREGRLRHLIRFDAPYIFEDAGRAEGHGRTEGSGRTGEGGRAGGGGRAAGSLDGDGVEGGDVDDPIGLHILEGSKPGAAAAAAWFAHRVVPLNQGGYGALIGKSIQSAQELYLKLAHDLRARLEKTGLRLRVLTDPPDLNLVCFAVNRADNPSLDAMNRLNRAIHDRLRFHDDQVIQRDDFMISSTVLRRETYGQPTPGGRSSLDGHLEYLGVPVDELREVGRMRILRCTIMSPWLDLSRGGRPDYVQAFCDTLEQVAGDAVADVFPDA